MFSASLLDMVARIHAAPATCSIITTGAGGTAIAALMAVPGCSKTLVDAQVPYHTQATQTLLDYYPDQYCSSAVAVDLAHTAFTKALSVQRGPKASPSHAGARGIVGIGCTAAIKTDRQRRGADVAFVSSWTSTSVRNYRLRLCPDKDRAAQEALVARVILKALADSADVPAPPDALDLPPVSCEPEAPDTSIEAACRALYYEEVDTRLSPFQLLLQGSANCVVFNTHGSVRVAAPPYTPERVDPQAATYLLYPGSFNPLHWGHTELLRAAADVMQRLDPIDAPKPVVATYEIASTIVGKQDLHEEDFNARVAQFTTGGRRVALTTAKLFVEKAAMFPHHGLVVGLDTAVRVLDRRYYDDDQQKMLAAMRRIRDEHHCYFVVGGRQRSDGEWHDLSSIEVPPELRDMFIGIPAADFRVDISSTQIRERRASTPPSATPLSPRSS